MKIKYVLNGFEELKDKQSSEKTGEVLPSYSFNISEPHFSNYNKNLDKIENEIKQATNQHIFDINNEIFYFEDSETKFNKNNRNDILWIFGPLKEYISKIDNSISWCNHNSHGDDYEIIMEFKIFLSKEMYSYIAKISNNFQNFDESLKQINIELTSNSTEFKCLETENKFSYIKPIIQNQKNMFVTYKEVLSKQRNREYGDYKFDMPEQYLFDKHSSTGLLKFVLPCLKKLRNIEPCIYRLIVLSNKLIEHIADWNNDLTGLKIYSNLFVSFLYELLKCNNDVKFSGESNNIFYVVENMKIIYDSQKFVQFRNYNTKFVIFDIFECKELTKTNGKKFNYYVNKKFDKFINKYCHDNRNKTFHVTLDEINNRYNDSNNFIYSFMVNNQEISYADKKQLLINFVNSLTDFTIECFLYCWEFIHIAFKSYNTPSSYIKEQEFNEYKDKLE